jgi:MFS family permease
MKHYSQNAKWLLFFEPFTNLSVSAAYLVPFFLEKGLSLSRIFLLQSIFSLALLVWEIPSGYIADRFGRAFSIKLSVPIAGLSMLCYGLSSRYWQFVACELGLAIAMGMVSGVDEALLIDSLKADGRADEFVSIRQRITTWGFAANAFGVPIAYLLVRYFSVSATVVADGFITLLGVFVALHLVEAPVSDETHDAEHVSPLSGLTQLAKSTETRWLLVLATTLGSATYLGFWVSAPYYTSIGIPTVLFGAILAVRNLWKAWLSRTFHASRRLERKMVGYALLAGAVFISMASKQLWLLWMVLGHDVVHALHRPPIIYKLNQDIAARYRATLNSVINLLHRLVYMIVGPLLGWLLDSYGPRTGYLVAGCTLSLIALAAIARLHTIGTFQDEGG